MPVYVKARIRDKGTFAYLNRVSNRAKKIPARELWNLTEHGAKEMIKSARQSGIKHWRGKLLKYGKGIEPRKLGKNRYGIFIPHYGIKLDKMSPHWVSLKRGRLITQWAKTASQSPFKGKNLPKSMKVEPHPFINEGYNRMLMRLDLVVKKTANKIIKG